MTKSTGEDQRTLHLDPLAYIIGVQGMALMRAFAGEHDAAFVEDRLAEIARLLQQRDQLGSPADLPLPTAAEGYDAWSASYDDPGNGLLAPDLARVTSMIDGHQGGLAIDIACALGVTPSGWSIAGTRWSAWTGRHAC